MTSVHQLLLSAATSALVAPLTLAAPAEARPYIYSNVAEYAGTYKECAAKAESALKKLGYENVAIEHYDDTKAADIDGFKSGQAAQISCYQKIGITTYIVSGLDNETTYNDYKRLGEADW